MKDKEQKLEETESSHTLGGAGEGRVQVRGKLRGCRYYSVVRYTIGNRSRRSLHMGQGLVSKKNLNLFHTVRILGHISSPRFRYERKHSFIFSLLLCAPCYTHLQKIFCLL